jgi:hypothetical protein
MLISFKEDTKRSIRLQDRGSEIILVQFTDVVYDIFMP